MILEIEKIFLLLAKVNTIDRYKTSLPDMIALAKQKIDSVQKDSNKNSTHHRLDIFLSYCRVNSQDAIDKGTPLKPGALGWGDPRAVKAHLEKLGYSVWVDFEQTGKKKTLFEDIVEGIRNAKLVVACVSNEYSRSENCMKEFRFASNLKMPIVMCVFGSASVNCEWRNTELGILSCLMNREINFQLENPGAYEELVKEIKCKLKSSGSGLDIFLAGDSFDIKY